MIFFKICLILTFLLLVTNISEAHLEVINKVIGEYRIELGIIPETPMAGSSTEFSVALENATSGQRFPDAEAWIRISHVTALFSHLLASRQKEQIPSSFHIVSRKEETTRSGSGSLPKMEKT